MFASWISIILLPSLVVSQGINWQGDWALSCDFFGQDLSSAKTNGKDCYNKCASTYGCTHFTWNNFERGTCWMKQGQVFKAQAFPTPDPTMACGIVVRKFNAFGINFSPIAYKAEVNNQLETYKSQNIFIDSNGLVTLRGLKDYSSGALTTKEFLPFTYGYVEVKAKLPKGKGFWPAIWLLNNNCNAFKPCGSNWPPELDIMEFRGDIPDKVTQTIQLGKYPTSSYSETPVKLISFPDFTQDYHTFAINWLPHKIEWFVDGISQKQFNAQYDEPWANRLPHESLYLVLNLAIGGDYPGNPDSKTVFPGDFLTKSVKIQNTFARIQTLHDIYHIDCDKSCYAWGGSLKYYLFNLIIERNNDRSIRIKSASKMMYMDSNFNGEVYSHFGNGGQFQNWIVEGTRIKNKATGLYLSLDKNPAKLKTSVIDSKLIQDWNIIYSINDRFMNQNYFMAYGYQ